MYSLIDRILPTSLIRGQWRVLTNRDLEGRSSPDAVARIFTYVIPLAAAVWVFIRGSLGAPEALLSAMSLFAAGLLTSFAHLSTWRDRLTERAESLPDADALDRDHLDETAAHLAAAAYGSIACAISLVVAMNTRPEGQEALQGLAAAIPTAFGTYVAVIMLIALPRLYQAYTSLNNVRPEMSGD